VTDQSVARSRLLVTYPHVPIWITTEPSGTVVGNFPQPRFWPTSEELPTTLELAILYYGYYGRHHRSCRAFCLVVYFGRAKGASGPRKGQKSTCS
jgi:hypothetical protein